MAYTSQDLTDVETAIRALVGGAVSYSINGRSVTKANLADLKRHRFDIMRELGTSSTIYAGRLRTD